MNIDAYDIDLYEKYMHIHLFPWAKHLLNNPTHSDLTFYIYSAPFPGHRGIIFGQVPGQSACPLEDGGISIQRNLFDSDTSHDHASKRYWSTAHWKDGRVDMKPDDDYLLKDAHVFACAAYYNELKDVIANWAIECYCFLGENQEFQDLLREVPKLNHDINRLSGGRPWPEPYWYPRPRRHRPEY
ncbi:hypothetical protein BO70DRAFT_397903 [Aspergillus heteromorphus CBS 117.55]|uniref:Uncharacterized protein n=1 Tax=Aspergillus heteromorphus CBS 117.55 TaxID=1448321 RepID=A0A317VSX1_9EURO|nr:uncharacterized protein BO70DRAFT_397903 [Aspergillus heteromorphus CBS 117.55]PWY77015.1 hypothetical protein BO70DRAFT_397903 [Aspergillus heteromorphus CBS 117.55]